MDRWEYKLHVIRLETWDDDLKSALEGGWEVTNMVPYEWHAHPYKAELAPGLTYLNEVEQYAVLLRRLAP